MIRPIVLSLLLVFFSLKMSAQPQIIKGELDLRNWDFKNQIILDLKGEWEFYWQKFLVSDSQNNTAQKPDGYLKVPGGWDGHPLPKGGTTTGHGFASYKLTIRLPAAPTKLGLFILYSATAHRVSIIDSEGNTIRIMEAGVIGKTKNNYIPSLAPQTASFIGQNDISLIVEIANFQEARGGLWQTPLLGSDIQIFKNRFDEKSVDFFIFGCMLIISLFSLIEYFTRKSEHTPLYFGLLSLMVILMICVRKGYLLEMFTSLHSSFVVYLVNLKIWYLSMVLVAMLFISFYSSLFEELLKNKSILNRLKRLKRFINLAFILYGITIILVTPRLITNIVITNFFYISIVIGFLWVFYALFWIGIKEKNPAAWLSLLALFVFFLSTINDILYSRKIILTANTQQFGYIFFIIQAYVLVRKNYKARSIAEAKARSLLENSPDIVLSIDRNDQLIYLNKPLSNLTNPPSDRPLEDYIGKSIYDSLPQNAHQAIKERINDLFNSGFADMIELKTSFKGQDHWSELRFAPLEEKRKIQEIIVTVTDITRKKNMENELASTQKELIEKAHKAGMAEIAADTLHNVGNVLNSINTSAHLITTALDNRPDKDFSKACEVIKSKLNSLGQFFDEDPMGKKWIEYMFKLDKEFRHIFDQIGNNSERLNEKIAIITEIIMAQQSYTTAASVTADVNIVEIIENALALTQELINDYKIDIIKNFQSVPTIKIQKSKLLHALVNLVKNAAEAMSHLEEERRTLAVKVHQVQSEVLVEIADNGEGIEEDNLTRIFNHGFTTKKEGNGFGLHSTAVYLQEMGASIEVHSEGIGKGATFTLRFQI